MAQGYIKSFIIERGTDKVGDDAVLLNLNNKVEIKKGAKLSCNNEDIKHSLKDIEKNLGVNLLNINGYVESEFLCTTHEDKNGNISNVELVNFDDWSGFNVTLESANKKHLVTRIKFMTNYATPEDEEYYKNISWVSTKDDELIDKETELYHIKSLNTDAIIYRAAVWGVYETACVFEYNNVLYDLFGRHINQDEMIEILENLKL